MRSLIPQIKNSCMALLGRAEVTTQIMSNRTEDIREFMLSELGEDRLKEHAAIARRIRYAQDVQGLWYARSDVMAILASVYGETVAAQKVAVISSMFKGLLPSSLTAGYSGRAR